MKDTIIKSWQTTVLGAVIIGFYIYKMVVLKEPVNVETMAGVITGLGVAASKYGGATHSDKK